MLLSLALKHKKSCSGYLGYDALVSLDLSQVTISALSFSLSAGDVLAMVTV